MTADPVARRRPRWAIVCILLATLCILAGYALAFGGPRGLALGAWMLAAGNALLAPAAMALGAPLAGGKAAAVRIALRATGIVLVVAFGAALTLPADEVATSNLVLGFPRRAAIVIYLAGVLPLLALPALFAWSFDAGVFDPERVQRIREARPVSTASDDPDDRSPAR